jgi:hypothetical protein
MPVFIITVAFIVKTLEAPPPDKFEAEDSLRSIVLPKILAEACASRTFSCVANRSVH